MSASDIKEVFSQVMFPVVLGQGGLGWDGRASNESYEGSRHEKVVDINWNTDAKVIRAARPL